MRLLLLFALGVSACSSSGSQTPVFKDMGSAPSGAIRPSHPENCAGKCCGSACTDTTIDLTNCGACGNKCGDGLVCKGGTCGCLPSGGACGMGQSCCPNAGCHSLDSDINNCGTCGHGCGDGSTCSAGKCVCGGATCGATQVCCNGSCADSCMSSMPDMAMGSGLPLCDCTGLTPIFGDQCPLSGQCVSNDCCAESSFIGNAPCTDTTPCQVSMTPQ